MSQALGYKGREAEPHTGLVYMRARWYDPALGRFLSEDPIGLAGGVNPYAFAENDPVNAGDPYGLCAAGQEEKTTYTRDENGNWAETKYCLSGRGNWSMESMTMWGRGNPLQQFAFGVASRTAPLGRVMNGIGEASGLNGLGRGGDALLRGDVAGGGAELALTLPVGGSGGGARTLAAAARTTTNEAEVFRRLAQYHGIALDLASDRLHAIKAARGRGGRDNVFFDLTGGVWDPATREWLGNLTEGGAKRRWR